MPATQAPSAKRASPAKRIIAAVLFVVIGLPAALMGLGYTVVTIGVVSWALSDNKPDHAVQNAVIFGIPCLIGFLIFGLMLRWVLRVFREPPSSPGGTHAGAMR